MARCGRCGLWNRYPGDNREKEYAGVCMWFQLRLRPDDEFKQRECSDFFERIPGMHAMDHFDYKLKRDNLGDAYQHAKQAKVLAYMRSSAPIVVVECSHWRQVVSRDATIAACSAPGGAERTARSFLLQSEHDNCGFSVSVFSDRVLQLDLDFF